MHDHHHDCTETDLGLSGLQPQTRRQFIRRAGLLSAAGLATPFALQLSSLAPAAAAASDDDYRALVCVFLYGGNDQWNTFIPTDAQGYAAYQAARGGLARDRGSALGIAPDGGFGSPTEIGFAPELSRLHRLFEQRDAAVVANVGTMLGPTTKAAYATPANRPPQLFSHNDQQSVWQSGALEGAGHGWGGRIADTLLDGNGEHSLFTSVSAAGNAVMMSGRRALQYQVSGRGVTTLRDDLFVSDSLNAELARAMNQPRGRLMQRAYADVTRRGLAAADELSDALELANQGIDFSPFFASSDQSGPTQNLTSQLQIVAQLIKAGRDVLGLRRQVFFVALGGFDNHSRLMEDHPPLLASLDIGIAGFHEAMRSIDAADSVTTFTASDFGRTLLSNGNGTDHGWGGHHLVVGGAVAGRRIVGRLPEVGDDTADDVGQGRLLPSISVDQYAATLATWLGVPDSELTNVAPHLARFDERNLGLF